MRVTLIKPIITEKMDAITEKYNKYGFIVDSNANKYDIKKAVEKQFNVDVLKVNTMNYDGKKKTRYTKAGVIEGRTKSYKKAIIQLAEGQVIDFYENI